MINEEGLKTYYQDNDATLYNQNFLDNDLPDESVQMVVTSPPYWGLRKYDGEQELIWYGDKDCAHEWVKRKAKLAESNHGQGKSTIGYRADGSYSLGKDGSPYLNELSQKNKDAGDTNTCSLCGAWRGAYGLEPTPEMYVQHTVEILREIRRVLRKDGVVFWNIGDSYASTNMRHNHNGIGQLTGSNLKNQELYSPNSYNDVPEGLKPKDLCLIPFRVAIAAQADGWWVRSIIVWSKPNPMPESVTDRPTESHEYILMLTKSARYYWDADAVREPHQEASIKRDKAGFNAAFKGRHTMPGEKRPHSTDHNGFNNPAGRNIRSVWEFPTQPYPEAHFAVFPEKLPETCIKAASKEGIRSLTHSRVPARPCG